MSHLACNLDDLVHWNGFSVLDVLLLLAISWWLLEGLDHEGGCRGNDGDSCLSILNSEADRNAEAFLELCISSVILPLVSY